MGKPDIKLPVSAATANTKWAMETCSTERQQFTWSLHCDCRPRLEEANKLRARLCREKGTKGKAVGPLNVSSSRVSVNGSLVTGFL